MHSPLHAFHDWYELEEFGRVQGLDTVEQQMAQTVVAAVEGSQEKRRKYVRKHKRKQKLKKVQM